MLKPFAFSLALLAAIQVQLPAADQVIISEFMASNSGSISDDFGDKSDWIELYNAGTNVVNLQGWYLTDTTNNYRKWPFPAVSLPVNSYLLVFASERDRRNPAAPLHTNFKLGADGEYLGLVLPDGTNIASEFYPHFPLQASDVSYGYSGDARSLTLVNTGNVARALVPANDFLGLTWTESNFADSAWLSGTTGVGYDRNTAGVNYLPLLGLNVEAAMFNINQTVYVRVPFTVTNVAELDTLTLRLQYDDGMIAYLNGHLIASDNAADPPLYNSGAPANRADDTAIVARDFNVTASRDFLQVGQNVLAFHAQNNGVGSSDLLLVPQLLARTRPSGNLVLKYFPVPTPGQPNNDGVATLGPIVTDAQFGPNFPQDNQDILVTARLRPTFAPISSAKLRYRVMYGAEVELPFLDDGLHSDGAAGDGVYGASIPATASTPGQMVRWFITATDTANAVTRVPSFADPLRSPEYLGTVVAISQPNNLPILHWFIQNATGADTTTGSRASLYYLGEFYDNVGMNLHGQSSSGFPKKSYDIDFHRGYNFRYAPGEKRVDDLNLLTIYPDKAHIRNILAYEAFRDAGTPYHFVVPVRVHQNGVFFSDAHMVENGDENYLERLGLDTRGALYKMYNTLNAATGEKKTRKDEGTADLQALINGSALPAGAARSAFLFDNINVPEAINYLAAQTITGNTDCCHKNYYLYRDTEGTGEWQILPWDVDLSYGRVWSGTPTYWDDVLYSNTRLFVGDNNTLIIAIYGTPELRQMYLRRLRTLMEELIQPPGTPASEGRYERRIDTLITQIAPDAALDLAKWGTWCCNSAGPYTQATIPIPANYQTMPQAASLIKTQYLPERRNFLFNQQTVGNGGEIPQAHPPNPVITITAIDYSPASSNQAQEYIELRNPNAYAVDLSGWRITGGVEFTFAPGTVMPANSLLYLSPDVRAFRARTAGPRGGQGLFVQGPYQGQLSARGETVNLVDRGGRNVASLTYPGNPSPAQQFLRITELMYHPSPLAGNTNSPEEFEYIEFKNIGTTTLGLGGVRLTNGVAFSFAGSGFTSLAPGASVLAVKNLALFSARYGASLPVAGQYEGSLDNSGERMRLIDAVGEEILDFDYNNSWYPITDGLGFSLVIQDELAEPDRWTLKESWRPSGQVEGSPGQTDPAPPVIAPVLINEALTRTTGVPDSIELYNPNPNAADVSGWFLTDDFGTPNKYRIPDGTIIAAGAYRVFTESNFNANPALPSSFALSSDGDEVYLFGADATGQLNGYVHGFDFGAAEEQVSFGRHVTSQGEDHFVPQVAVTLNGPNSGPRIGPVVISEIMYHPPEVGTNDNPSDEFIELLNITGNTVPLYDPLRPANTWQLAGGAQFTFPTNVSLAPGESLLLLNITPTDTALIAALRARYGIGANVQLLGPYTGKLNNDADEIALTKPTTPITNQTVVTVPYALVERIAYEDQLPWPKSADGLGYSLQRWNPQAYGNDPINWVATRPTAAAATVTNGLPPLITLQPVGQTLIAGSNAALTATVTGTAPFNFQWRLNGTNLPGATSQSLLLNNVQPQQAGNYELIVDNAVGSVFSQVAKITVRLPVLILQQPQTADVRIPPDPLSAPTTNVTFGVSANSIAPLHYQWRRNGVDIPGATGTNITIVGVQTNDLALYTVVISDDVSTVESAPAGLYPLISPNFVELPLSQSVAAGTKVTLSGQVSGWPPPFTFEWRLGASTLQSNVQNEPFTFFTVTAPTNGLAISYRAIVRNRALPSGRITPFTVITPLPDSDNDGLPDQWETTFGATETLADTDGDQMLNWQEYQAGTDPTNALSYLKFDSMIWSNGMLRLEFQAASNRTYAVQFNADLGSTNWQTVSHVTARSTPRTAVVVEPPGPTVRFYRIVTPHP